MQGEDLEVSIQLITGYKQIIGELLRTIDCLLIALEIEADYPGERTREEISNAKALYQELVDIGYK